MKNDKLTFRPSHKLLILTNHRPQADASDYALWARLLLIPFKITFVDEPAAQNERKADTDLSAKLKAEASGNPGLAGPGLPGLAKGRVEPTGNGPSRYKRLSGS